MSATMEREKLPETIGLLKKYSNGEIIEEEFLDSIQQMLELGNIDLDCLIIECQQANLTLEFVEKVQNLENWTPYHPKYKKRMFSSEDAEFITRRLIANPKAPIYRVITNKIKTKLFEEITKSEDGEKISNSINAFVECFGQSKEGWIGGPIIDEDRKLLQSYSNSKESKSIRKSAWDYYSCGSIGDNNSFEQKQSKTRIYLKAKLENLHLVWSELNELLTRSEDIWSNGFSSKIPNFWQASDYSMKVNQDDKIIFYLPAESEYKSMKIISNYVSKNPELFEAFHSLGTSLVEDSVFCASEVTQSNQSFNSIQAKIIEKIISEFISIECVAKDKSELFQIMQNDARLKFRFERFLKATYNSSSKEFCVNPNNIGFLIQQKNKPITPAPSTAQH